MVSTEVDHPDIGEARDAEDDSAVRHVTVAQTERENNVQFETEIESLTMT